MTWVKLCGMRSAADVAAAVAAGADAIGFVIAEESVRRVTPEEGAAYGERADIERFVVSVDMEPESLLAAAAASKATGVQPHGRHAAAAAEAALTAGYRVLFPIPVGAAADLGGVPAGAVPLVDTAVAGRHGGTGLSFDWRLVADIERPIVIAGGLRPDNVERAIAVAAPWGVDVSSGIERAPGVKDHDKMRRFVEAVR
jgi:phosphoribosylanthranilate isomerase